jgi:hypothetical protein
MSAAESLVGRTLTGSRKGQKWLVTERLQTTRDASLGYNSVVYFVEDEAGQNAFLKASDLGMFTSQAADTLEAMQL